MNGNAVGIAYATLASDRLANLKAMMDSIINAETAYVTPVLKALFLIYLGRQFLMMNWGYVSGNTFVSTMLRSGIIILLVTKAGAYVQYIRDPIFDRVPQALAAMASSSYGGAGTVAANPAQQFDDTALAINHITAQILALNTSWSVAALGNYFSASLSNGGAQAILACIVAVWMLGMTLLAIILCFGKVILLFELFNRTRGFVDSWIGKMLGIVAYGFGTNILMALLMTELMTTLTRASANLPSNAAEAVSVLAGIVGNLIYDLVTLAALPVAVGFSSSAAASLAAPSALLALRGGGAAARMAAQATTSTARSAMRGSSNAVNRGLRSIG